VSKLLVWPRLTPGLVVLPTRSNVFEQPNGSGAGLYMLRNVGNIVRTDGVTIANISYTAYGSSVVGDGFGGGMRGL